MSIFLGCIIFFCFPCCLFAWLPFYYRLKEEGKSTMGIIIATLMLWYTFIIWFYKRVRKFGRRHFKCLRPVGQASATVAPSGLTETQQFGGTANNETAQVMKIH